MWDMRATSAHDRAPQAPPIRFGADRGALIAGLSFVRAMLPQAGSDAPSGGWGREELTDWLDVHLIQPGRMRRVASVQEAIIGTISLSSDLAMPSRMSESSLDMAPPEELPRLLQVARSRVVVTLRAFASLHTDDRFLSAAIYNERVRRARVGDRTTWVAQPAEDDMLSDVVLSLFAADILMHRVFHERALCVCDTCGRVSFDPDVTTRKGCFEHMPPSGATSGFIQKWVRATEPPPPKPSES